MNAHLRIKALDNKIRAFTRRVDEVEELDEVVTLQEQLLSLSEENIHDTVSQILFGKWLTTSEFLHELVLSIIAVVGACYKRVHILGRLCKELIESGAKSDAQCFREKCLQLVAFL